MRLSDLHYELPPELIAQEPTERRGDSRLLEVGPGERLRDRRFPELAELLGPDDLLVFNDTRVIPARLYGEKPTGGRVEMLVERVLGPDRALAYLRSSKPNRPGQRIRFEGALEGEVLGREDDLYRLRFETGDLLAHLEAHGHLPLPPYIQRPDDARDRERYQTVFAREPGAVAAPTAGLHFDQPLLAQLEAAGVRSARVTLHVGAGTFEPVRCERVEDHRMHAERVRVTAAVCEAVAETRARGGRVVAVGSTSVRSLEAAAAGGELAPLDGETDIYLRPGSRFRVVDAMITNFHLPGSSLLVMVAAYAGAARIRAAYAHAVRERYRFFSYGDAMFLTPDPAVRA